MMLHVLLCPMQVSLTKFVGVYQNLNWSENIFTISMKRAVNQNRGTKSTPNALQHQTS